MSDNNSVGVSILRIFLLLIGLLGLPILTLLFGPYGFILAIVFIILAAVAK